MSRRKQPLNSANSAVSAAKPPRVSGTLKQVGGSICDDWNDRVIDDTLGVLWVKNSDAKTRDSQMNATLAGLIGIGPKDELEGMMAAQLIAAHSAAMECYRRAMLGEQSFEGRRENLTQANKLSRTFAVLLEALNRHRGKGQQKVTVEHVHSRWRGFDPALVLVEPFRPSRPNDPLAALGRRSWIRWQRRLIPGRAVVQPWKRAVANAPNRTPRSPCRLTRSGGAAALLQVSEEALPGHSSCDHSKSGRMGMRRRDFTTALVCAAAYPTLAGAQQKAMPVIGFLSPLRTPASSSPDPFIVAFHKGLGEAGYVERQNLAIEYRRAEGNYDRLPALAADLVGRKVDVIVAVGGAAGAAKSATSVIPIVFYGVGDPVGFGLVTSLARPGGNLTGFSNVNTELHPKRLELMSELVPQARVIALLVNPTSPGSEAQIRVVQEAARAKGVQLQILKAATASEIDAPFATFVELHGGALLIGSDNFFYNQREQLVALASRHAVPASYMWREFSAAGGLISYGIDSIAVLRQVGIYAGRILKGEKPADLPVQQPTKFELVINLKTAQALGLTVPQSLLARADEVIE
jgi:putative tryptophan/tyrosine transport system substrate-binding protein